MAASSSSTSLFHPSLRLPSPPIRSLAPSPLLPLSRPNLALRSPLRCQREPYRGRPSVRCKVGLIDQSAFGEEVLEANGFVLVEFVADWCGPCRLIGPVVDWVAKEYRDQLKVVKIDHDANPELIEEYKVYGLPTLILFKDGKEIPGSRREGAITKIKLKEVLESFLETKTVS